MCMRLTILGVLLRSIRSGIGERSIETENISSGVKALAAMGEKTEACEEILLSMGQTRVTELMAQFQRAMSGGW